MPDINYIVLESTVILFIVGWFLKMLIGVQKKFDSFEAKHSQDKDRLYQEIDKRTAEIERDMMSKEVFDIFRSEVKDMKNDLTFIKNFLLKGQHYHLKDK